MRTLHTHPHPSTHAGLTRLHLGSTHGTHAGGLSRLRSLPNLASLTLSDVGRGIGTTSRPSPHDLVMLLAASALTHLQLGHHCSIHLGLPLVRTFDSHSHMWSQDL